MNLRLTIFVQDLSLKNFRLDMLLGNFRLGSFVQRLLRRKLSLGHIHLGTFALLLEVNRFRSRSATWNL